MRILFAAIVYLLFAILLGAGILQAVGGHYGLLIGGAVFYLTLLGLIGCIPQKSHH